VFTTLYIASLGRLVVSEVEKMARKPETTWQMLDVAMSHFQAHIASKSDRCALSIIDLLHVSNFKGGNASITEPVQTLAVKLKHYESILKKLEKGFASHTLVDLNDKQTETLKSLCNDFLKLTEDPTTAIRGFGPSYASAILAAHFIDLVPVLDRRVLNGAGIKVQSDSQHQVKNIAAHYSALISAFRQELRRAPRVPLRQLDRRWFSKPLISLRPAAPKAARRSTRRYAVRTQPL
jgi:hypothetical protein